MACTSSNSAIDNDITVEQYLAKQCETMMQDLNNHGLALVAKLRQEFREGSDSIRAILQESQNLSKNLCVILKCIAGPHLGQRFRLEVSSNDVDDIFKMGRSTGRHFREKGVSLYKDKEISTSHAKIEIRNGQVFLTDTRSTNGTQLNGKIIEAHVPMRLSEGDVITLGSTELQVTISEDDILGSENISPNL